MRGRDRPRLSLVTAIAAAMLVSAVPRTASAGPPAAPEASEPGSEATAPAPPAAPQGLVPPALLNEATITYPPALAAQDEPPRGDVIVKYTIDPEGIPRDATVEQGLHPELDALAVQAVESLRYTPATVDGQPVAVINRIAIGFAPPEPVEPEPVEPEPVEPGPVEPVPVEPGPTASAEPEPTTSAPVDPAGPVRIEGTLLEAGQRTPVPDASVVVVPAEEDAELGYVRKRSYEPTTPPAWSAEALTDEEGRFSVAGIPSGKIRVVIVAPGYERLEFVERLPENEAIAVKYFAQRLPTNPYRTVVRMENPREEVARRTITADEINAIPGTQGDALKAIQNFPGVARAPFGIGLLVIRGTGPNDSLIQLGYHEIPQLFHFGGLTSVFNSDILERIEFIPGNFDPRYGDALGGVIDVHPRAGRRDGYHGYIDADVFDAGLLFEGPVGKGSFVLSARRSYIDAILPVVIPDDAGLDLTVAPRYYDYQALFDYPVGGGKLSIRGFGSDDRTVLVSADPNDIETDERDQFETTVYFHRADVVYEKDKGPWRFLITPSYRYEFLNLGAGDTFRFKLSVHNLDGRAEVRRQLTRRTALTVGAQYRSGWFEVDVTAPPIPSGMPQGSTDERLSADIRGFIGVPSVYGTLSLGLGDKFTLYPGARVSYYAGLLDTIVFDPRLQFGWSITDRTTLKGGVGLYSQGPDPAEANAVFGNPGLGSERALQNSLGVSHRFDQGYSVDGTVFYNELWDLVGPSEAQLIRDPLVGPESERLANTRRGRVYGLEVLLRKDLTTNFFGWIAYTLSRSERRDPGESWRLFDFDQTHILTLIGVYKLPKNWQIGARFRLVSGNPNTPIVGGVFDASTGGYTAIPGPTNSERLPIFHQLDVRVDKTWVWRRLSWMIYLDVQNAYNAQNTEFWQYGFNFRERREIASLPIIPSLGTKLEF